MKSGAYKCPGLAVSERGSLWVDSTGQQHDLAREKLLSPKDVARMMGRSVEWVCQKIRSNELYPHFYENRRVVLVYACAVNDYYNRSLAKHNGHAA